MVALSGPLVAQAPGDQRWLRVEDPSAAAACRGAAAALAGRLDFPAARAGQLVLAVTEAATNLHKHASQGSMLLRIARHDGHPGIEMVTIDAGPGFRDTHAAMRDGHSTAGTLGIGLGAISRLADFTDLYSVPGRGTALVARFWPSPRAKPVAYAGLVRPITGETECGDVFGAAETGSGLTGVLCDGLGHGPLAATAALEAVAAVMEDPSAEPAVLVERAHRRITHTRGGAIGVVQSDGRAVRFAAASGNIAATILAVRRPQGHAVRCRASRATRRGRSGSSSTRRPTARPIILHSDGLSGRWEAESLPGLNARDPLVIAAMLLAEAGTRRDDAGVLVLKP